MGLTHSMYEEEVRDRGDDNTECAIEAAYRRGFAQGAYSAIYDNPDTTFLDRVWAWRYAQHAGRFEIPPPARQEIWTYFIRCGDRIKIGKSKNPENRVKMLQTGAPEKLQLIGKIPGNYEPILHEQFAASRVGGEWFEATPELVSYAMAYSHWETI